MTLKTFNMVILCRQKMTGGHLNVTSFCHLHAPEINRTLLTSCNAALFTYWTHCHRTFCHFDFCSRGMISKWMQGLICTPCEQESIPVGCVRPAWKPTVCASVKWPPPDVWQRGTPNEQAWTGLQWSPPYVTSRGVGPQVWCLSRYPYQVTYPMMQLMLPNPLYEQTEACENITLLQLPMRAVKIYR